MAGSRTMVLFGGSGDLARRKPVPALDDLAVCGNLPERFSPVATGGRGLSDDELHRRFTEAAAHDLLTRAGRRWSEP